MPDAPDSGTIPQDDSIERDLKRRVRRAERQSAETGEPVASILGDGHVQLCRDFGVSMDSADWPENQESAEEGTEVEGDPEAPSLFSTADIETPED